MNKEIEELFKEKTIIYTLINNVASNLTILEQAKEICLQNNSKNKLNGLINTINDLQNQNYFLHNKYDDINNKIKDIQSKCNHDMKYDGHDSHHDYYKCSICGFEEKY